MEEEDDEKDDDITNAIESSNSESENDVELDGFAPAGVGYMVMSMKKRVSKVERKKIAREEAKKDKDDDVSSLTFSGQVKKPLARFRFR